MAGTNTEKPTGKAEKLKTAPATKKAKAETPKKAAPAPKKDTIKKTVDEKSVKDFAKDVKEDKKESKKKVEVKKVKKTKVTVIANNSPVSTKVAAAICKFIKKKTLRKAIADLEQVTVLKKAVPMKGEIPHRKGKIMSGRFPQRASKEFLVLVKSLESNAIQHDLEDAVISEAIANKGTTTYAKGGRARKKRSNIYLAASQKKVIKKKKKKE